MLSKKDREEILRAINNSRVAKAISMEESGGDEGIVVLTMQVKLLKDGTGLCIASSAAEETARKLCFGEKEAEAFLKDAVVTLANCREVAAIVGAAGTLFRLAAKKYADSEEGRSDG